MCHRGHHQKAIKYRQGDKVSTGEPGNVHAFIKSFVFLLSSFCRSGCSCSDVYCCCCFFLSPRLLRWKTKDFSVHFDKFWFKFILFLNVLWLKVSKKKNYGSSWISTCRFRTENSWERVQYSLLGRGGGGILKKKNDPIGARKITFRPFKILWQTDRSTDQPTHRPKGRLEGLQEVILPINEEGQSNLGIPRCLSLLRCLKAEIWSGLVARM